MPYTTTNSVLAALALVADLATVVIWVAFISTRFRAGGRQRWRHVRLRATPLAQASAWIVAVFCTCSSLFLQFGEGLDPCDLCWFQRVCMYPQALLLGVSLFARDRSLIRLYAVPLAAVGAAVSILHINISAVTSWLGTTTLPGCSLSAPCSVQPITEFGFVTIPFMALSGFLLIITLLLTMADDDVMPLVGSDGE